MPTFRASLALFTSLVALPAIAQPAPPPENPAPANDEAARAAAPPTEADPGESPIEPDPEEAPRAETAATESPPPPPVDDPAVPPIPPPGVEPEAKPAYPDRLSIGKSGGYFQPGGLLQFWALGTYTPSDVNDLEGDSRTTSTFRLRRAEIRAKGEIVPEIVGYQLMIDAAKTLNVGSEGTLSPSADTSILQDYYITFMTDVADISFGQYKTPISYEGYNSSSKTLFPERSRVARAYGDRRDIGLRIEKKLGDVFYYYAGVFNGAGINRVDDDNEKDLALRVEVYPVKGLLFGAMGYATVGERDETARDRVEGDLRFEGGGFLLQGEYIRAWDTPATGEVLEGHGAYGALGFTIIERIQPIVRVGFVDPDVDTADTTLMHYEGGLNYFLRGNEMKLSLVGGTFVPDVGRYVFEGLLAAQVSY